MSSEVSRAEGALWGVAIGDALGMPTQAFSRQEIQSRFGALVTTLHDAPSQHPYAHGLRAGHVTDDTEQTVLLADLLIRYDGEVPLEAFATMLRSWEKSVEARGLRDLLGPSTTAALDKLSRGVSADEVGLGGDTNGAAMRVVPIAIATGMNVDVLVRRIVSLSSLTHRSVAGLAAAGAVGGYVAAAIDGASDVDIVTFALSVMESCASWGPGDDEAVKIFRRALTTPPSQPMSDSLDNWAQHYGVGVRAVESVATAIATVRCHLEDPWRAVCLCASLGDDTDTMASIAGGLIGAREGVSIFPSDIRHVVAERNALEMSSIASSLLAIRR